jgi:alpha-L-fucosidase
LENDGIASDIKLETFTCQDFRFTQKDGRIYAIALGWPENGQLVIRALRKSKYLPGVQSITLCGSDAPIGFSQTEEALIVSLPAHKPCQYAFALCIEPL